MSIDRYILIVLALLIARVTGAEVATNFMGRLIPIPPCPACQASAKANHIPLAGIDPPAQSEVLSPGNSETALITWHQKSHPGTQWLLYFQAVANTNTSPAKPGDPMVLYTSTGNKFEFGSKQATIRVRTLGPFIESNVDPNPSRIQPAPIDKSARIDVDQTFLGLGLDQATAALHRLYQFEEQRKQDKIALNFGISGEPFSPSTIKHDRAAAEAMQLTLEEERALAGGIPALYAYFNSVQQTPELDSILFKVVSMPSVWSIMKNLGLSPGIAIGSPRKRVGPLSLPDWELQARSSLYALPVQVSLNNHPALTLTMIVTDPHPPFLVCGGIVGFLAENPDDPENYLTLRIVNAHL
jgi:hypothetical protein